MEEKELDGVEWSMAYAVLAVTRHKTTMVPNVQSDD